MSSSECPDYYFLKFCIVIFFITIFLLNYRKFLRKICRRTFNENGLVNELHESEIPDALKFIDYVLELQNLAQKVCDDKANLYHFGDPDCYPFHDRTLIEVSKKYSSIQDQINETLEEARLSSDQQFEAARTTLEVFRDDYIDFKTSVENVLSLLVARDGERKKQKNHVENTTETQELCNHNEECFLKEICKNENMNIVLFNVKNCMDKIIEESRWNWKKTVLEISEFLAQNYQDIKTQLDASVQTNAERIDPTQQATLTHIKIHTDDIEKQMLDIIRSLDRQVVDFQTVHDALEFFNRKFVHFSEKCHDKWDSHCSRYDSACRRIQEVRDDLDNSSGRMSDVSRSLSKQSPVVSDLLGQLESAVQSVVYTYVGPWSCLEVVVATVEDMSVVVQRMGQEFDSRMSYLSEALKKPGEQVDAVLQTIEDLEVLNDLIRNIESAYACTVALPSVAASDDPSRYPCAVDGDDATEASFEDECYGDCDANGVQKDSPYRRIISMVDDAINKTKNQKRVTGGASLESTGNYTLKDAKVWSSNLSDVTLNDPGNIVGNTVHFFQN